MHPLSYDWEETESELLVRVHLSGVPRRGLDLFGAFTPDAVAAACCSRAHGAQ